MNVKLVGTGAIYTKYNGACTLVDNTLIVDMPNGTLKQLLKKEIDCKNIKTILITHKHGDHTADVPFFLKHIFNGIKDSREITIIGPNGIKRKIIELFNAYNFENEEEISKYFNLKFIEVLEDKINVNGYEIKSYIVSHGEEKPALGYVINNQLGLTGDTGICDGVEQIVKQSKIIIADSSLINGEKCHMGVDNLQYLNTKYGKLIICTHLRDETRQYIKENSSIEGIKVLEDFEEINL